jgi:HK97 family phage major capsid protein
MNRKKRKFLQEFGGNISLGYVGMRFLMLALPMFLLAGLAFAGLSLEHSSAHGHGLSIGLGGVGALVAVTNATKELGEKRNKLATEMAAITNKAKEENRGLSSDETAKWDKLNADIEAIDATMERVNKSEAIQAELGKTTAPPLDNVNDDRVATTQESAMAAIIAHLSGKAPKRPQSEHDKAFEAYMRKGFGDLAPAEQQLIAGTFVDENGKRIRAAQTVTTTGGGYLIPAGFSQQLEEALKWFGGMYQAAEVFTTESGNPLPWPTVDDRSNVGELLAINTAAAAQDLTFGQITLGAYKYSSKIVLVPIELLQDGYFDLNTFLARKLGERLGRITNTHSRPAPAPPSRTAS